MGAGLRTTAAESDEDSPRRIVAHRSESRAAHGAGNRNRRPLLGTGGERRADGHRLCAHDEEGRPRPDSFRVGRLDDPAAAARAGRAPEIFAAAQSRRGRSGAAKPLAQLHELWAHPVQGQPYHAIRPPACG